MDVDGRLRTAASDDPVERLDDLSLGNGAYAAIAQMFVESESGDILSPKYAPETTAPATTGSGA